MYKWEEGNKKERSRGGKLADRWRWKGPGSSREGASHAVSSWHFFARVALAHTRHQRQPPEARILPFFPCKPWRRYAAIVCFFFSTFSIEVSFCDCIFLFFESIPRFHSHRIVVTPHHRQFIVGCMPPCSVTRPIR